MKIISCLLVIILVNAIFLPVAEAEIRFRPEIRLKIVEASFFSPDYLEFDLVINAPAPINAGWFELSFEPEKLAWLETNYLAANDPLVVFESADNETGRGYFLAGFRAPVAGETVIARLKFHKVAAGWTKLGWNDNTVLAVADASGARLSPAAEIHLLQVVK